MRSLILLFVTSVLWLVGCGDNNQPVERDESDVSTAITMNDAITTTTALQGDVSTSRITDTTVADTASNTSEATDSVEKSTSTSTSTTTSATTPTTAVIVTTTTSTTVLDVEPYDYTPMETYEPSSGGGSDLVTYEPSG